MDNPTIVFDQPRVVKIVPAELPRPGRGEILVETIVSLISTGTELTILSGEFPAQSTKPPTPTHACWQIAPMRWG